MRNFIVLSSLLAIAAVATNGFKIAEKIPFNNGRSVQGFPFVPVKSLEVQGRITEGEIAAHGQFPYQVALTLYGLLRSAFCGGTLISPRWVVSAAHCVDGALFAVATLGAQDLSNSNEPNQLDIPTDRIHPHPQYNPNTIECDISVLRLSWSVVYNAYIQPAYLPTADTDPYPNVENYVFTVSGWGRNSDNATTISNQLNYIEVPGLNPSDCNATYKGGITDKMICTSGEDGHSPCNGDSGGPSAYKRDVIINGSTEKRTFVVGIVSFGSDSGCQSGYPAVYTRVYSYVGWIQQKTGVSN